MTGDHRRVEKLETLCRAAMRLRKRMLDPEPDFFTNLFVPREAVKDFDGVVETLKQQSEDNSHER